jgi:hypothetical protein
MLKHVVFADTLAIAGAPGSEKTKTEKSPVAGVLHSIELHQPNGSNGLVQVAVFINDSQIFPYSGYQALNDVTKDYPMGDDIAIRRYKDDIVVVMKNGDGASTHRCVVTVAIKAEQTPGAAI